MDTSDGTRLEVDEVPSPQFRTQADIAERLDRIQSKRKDLEHVLRALDAEEIRLRRLWNSFLPVNDLPIELLVKVFQLDAGDTEPVRRLPAYMRWVRLILVCTYWREVACATPTLWSAFAVAGSAPARLDLCLARSGTTGALHISLTSPSPDMVEQVATHSERLQAVSIYHPPPMSLSHLLERPMPILHELIVTGIDKTLHVRVTPTHYPVLRSLDLCNVTIPPDYSIYIGLRRLSLSACGLTLTTNGGQMVLFDALRVTTRLESLSISKMLRAFPQVIAPGAPPIVLPYLSELAVLDELPEDVSAFLAPLRLSPQCSVTLRAGPNHVLEEWEEVIMSDMLPRNRAEVLPTLSSASAVELIMKDRDFALRGSSAAASGEDRGSIECSLISRSLNRWEIFLEVGLRELIEVFRGAPVKQLRVTGDHRMESARSCWSEVFEAFPMLDTVELSGWGAGTPMWIGLDMASGEHLSQDSDDEGGEQASIACPGLRTVVVDGRSMMTSAKFFEAMLECLRRRVGHAAPLETLRLKLSPKQKELEELKARYSPYLQGLVGNVSYELYE
ncbi:hypothetical protein L226DRAFT_225637 [Lentinus tigrinus ALCF2SS1-7]|uniref:F-box domain-containing protein n=1 Tax=Lentinus tigrinus ALCF2SS1-6 TaxID=1328759 RepID=A0A5C2RQN7_9APHY|nr:hypothetical protein L227DRAFT_376552 [Lentinus tigrinus ALCF2SS1-6]RPD70561.1 hypothetical protein L226DRAFT_225637 [Lentinus tigrinus ALCF2SS1-7]